MTLNVPELPQPVLYAPDGTKLIRPIGFQPPKESLK